MIVNILERFCTKWFINGGPAYSTFIHRFCFSAVCCGKFREQKTCLVVVIDIVMVLRESMTQFVMLSHSLFFVFSSVLECNFGWPAVGEPRLDVACNNSRANIFHDR